jgi:dTDP-4-dehydrorhamnose 3,5-epimerase
VSHPRLTGTPAEAGKVEVEPRAPQDLPTVDEQGRSVRPLIDGVVHERLQPQVDHRGELVEVMNFDRPFWNEPVPYSYSFTVAPGRVKGWGMHKLQSDRYFPVSGCLRVVLYDGRVGSPSQGLFNQFHFTATARGLLLIPPGVWHADQNWGEDVAVVMNFPTRAFNPGNPDKYRVDPHSGEIPFDWSLPDS